MERVILQPKGLAKSIFYSSGYKVKGGTLLFIAGQVGRDADGNVVGKGNMEVQTRRGYENLKLVLESGGGTLSDVVKTTIFVTDIEAFQKVSMVRAEFFPKDPPPNTLVEVKRLAHPDLMFEIEAIAVIND